MENKIYIKDLPIGTRIESPNSLYEIRQDGIWVLKSITIHTPFRLYRITPNQTVGENWNIIYPYGYNTPLWKVLNGEA